MAATSRIDFTPAQTTVMPVAASVARSADSSQRLARAAVHAAEPAGGEHADAGARGEVRGRGDRGGGRAAARDHGREVAHARLGDVVAEGERLERVVVEPDADDAVDDGDRGRARRRRARTAASISRATSRLRPAREPVGDERALQRDDRDARRERVRHLGLHLHAC